MEAYVMVETKGNAKKIFDKIKRLSGVECASLVTGPYDIVAYVEGRNLSAIGQLVIKRIRGISGVEKTLTCAVVEE